jgi:hypothetical protein
VLNPPTGLGVFIADMYQGDPNNTPYTDKGAVYHAGAGAFESVQGNVCQGDTNNLAFTSGSGVSSGWVDQIGTATSAPDGSYLWVHFMVDLADPYGNQFQVLYEYRFYASEVDLWTKVQPCPDGACHADARGPAPFLKMPKFEYSVSGPAMDYQTETCYDSAGNVIQTAGQTDYPNGSTVHNHCDTNPRSRIDVYNSSSGLPPFRVTATSQPVASFGPSYGTYPWESTGTSGYGIDKWAAVGQSRQHLVYSSTLNSDNNCGVSGPAYSYMDSMRKWEMGGDNPAATWGQNLQHYYPYKTMYAMFKGWEDGNGPPNCRSLYNAIVPNEAYANFFRLTNG